MVLDWKTQCSLCSNNRYEDSSDFFKGRRCDCLRQAIQLMDCHRRRSVCLQSISLCLPILFISVLIIYRRRQSPGLPKNILENEGNYQNWANDSGNKYKNKVGYTWAFILPGEGYEHRNKYFSDAVSEYRLYLQNSSRSAHLIFTRIDSEREQLNYTQTSTLDLVDALAFTTIALRLLRHCSKLWHWSFKIIHQTTWFCELWL